MNADERMRELARNREDAWLNECLSLAEARREGEQNTMLKVARNMLTQNISIDVIEKVTGLSQNELSSL
jgi:predicted transposase YdaD